MVAQQQLENYLPGMEVVSTKFVQELKQLNWYHSINIGDYITPGRNNKTLWNSSQKFLQAHKDAFDGQPVLEFGPADGLWSCWLAKLGAAEIVSVDFRRYKTYEMIIETFGLPVTYSPGVISTQTPRVVQQTFKCLLSFGVLYHVHDVLNTLIMYNKYLDDGGFLFLETAVVDDDLPALYYSPDGLILPAKANNQFVPSTGFLRHSLCEQLGMEIRDELHMPVARKQGLKWGRHLVLAQKVNSSKVSMYNKIVELMGFNKDLL